MKKRIGILTFHNAVNVGAMLQAYALCKTFNKLNFDCEIIDYRVGVDAVDHEWFSDIIKRHGVVKGVIKYINRLIFHRESRKNLNFANFMRKYMKLSPIYRTENEFSQIDYDAVVYGSDQVWNPDLLYQYRPEFFGGLIKEKIDRIGYAASTGTGNIKSDIESKALELIKNFKSIGVREEGLAKYLEEKLNRKIDVNVDPTLLLETSEWQTVIGKLPKSLKDKKYIFVYTYDDAEVYDYAKSISKETGYEIITFWKSKHLTFENTTLMDQGGPDEFLALVANAEYIVTSSFHGTVFSILLKKRFYSIVDEDNIRVNNLLSCLHLDEKKEEYKNKYIYDNTNVDYVKTGNYLSELRKDSLDFIGGIGNEC